MLPPPTPAIRSTTRPVAGSSRTAVRLDEFPAHTDRPSVATTVHHSLSVSGGPILIFLLAPKRRPRRSIVPPPVGGFVSKFVPFAIQSACGVTARSSGCCAPPGNDGLWVFASIRCTVLSPPFPTQTEPFPAATAVG